jgi:high-affinity nickel-transport protein
MKITYDFLPALLRAPCVHLGHSLAFTIQAPWLQSFLHGFSQQKLGPSLFVASLGLVLGIRHSTDADHVVAISTIVTRQRGIRGAALIGSLWGLGHTVTIFLVGCLIILGGVVIPPRVGLSMEFCVALMLILLGILNLTGVMAKIVARLTPAQLAPAGPATGDQWAKADDGEGGGHARRTGAIEETFGRYGLYQCLRPLAIGLVHGLAGSAAIALLVLSTIHSALWAVLYLVIFGAGTMLGMMSMTAAMSLPIVYAGDRLPQVSRYLGVASGLVSLCFGTFLVYQLGFLGGLFTSHPHWTPQ